MSELILPNHIVDERVRLEFKPFLRYAVSICPNALRKSFESKVVGWLLSLPAGAREELKQTYFQGKPPAKGAIPRAGGKYPRHLSALGIRIAQTMVNKFIDNAKEGAWKAGQGSHSQSAPLPQT